MKNTRNVYEIKSTRCIPNFLSKIARKGPTRIREILVPDDGETSRKCVETKKTMEHHLLMGWNEQNTTSKQKFTKENPCYKFDNMEPRPWSHIDAAFPGITKIPQAWFSTVKQPSFTTIKTNSYLWHLETAFTNRYHAQSTYTPVI